MYAKRRFSRYPRRFVRTKRNGAWIGTVALNVTLTGQTASSWYLWDDLASQRLNLGGKGRHERTLIWMFPFFKQGPTPVGLGWHLNVYQTDASNNVPVSSIISPWDQAIFEKSPMNVGYREIVPQAGPSVTGHASVIELDVRVKRKLDDTDAILFTVSSAAMLNQGYSGNTYFGFVARTYVSW